jgi:hypothetical protein
MLYKEFTEKLPTILVHWAQLFKLFENFPEFKHSICKILSHLITRKTYVVPEQLDLFTIPAYLDIFDLKSFLKANFKTFLKLTPVSIWSQDLATTNILELLSID